MKTLGMVLFCLLFATGLTGDAPAFDEAALSGMLGHIVIARTTGGGEFQGKLLAVREDRIEILTAEGQILGISRDALAEVTVRDPSRDQSEYFQDSASNRLILMPTGFGMERGEFHIAAQEIVVITTSYGITPNFSAWAGVSIPGALVNFRFSTPVGSGGAVSLGSFFGMSWVETTAGVGLPYALASYGNPNRNLTFGAGVPFYWMSGSTPRPAGVVAAIGGKIIVSATASIVTENWIVAISDGWKWEAVDIALIPAAVFRIAGSRLSWDIGAVLPLRIHPIPTYSTMGEVTGTGPVGLEGMLGGTVLPLPILSVTYRID